MSRITDRSPPWAYSGLDEKWGVGVAKALIKAEMAKRSLTYKTFSNLLAVNGINEDDRNLRNKISRGQFSAAFFFQCMMAMGVQSLDLSHIYSPETWFDKDGKALI